MENTANEISIKVTIGDRQYPLTINAGEEEYIRNAAKMINDKAKFYLENFAVKDKQDSIALAALDFTAEMLSVNQDKTTQTNLVDQKLVRFQQLIDSALR